MTNYLRDTEYATKELFKALKSEQVLLENLKNELNTKKGQLEPLKADYASYQQMEDYDEMKLQHKFIMMAKTFERIPVLEKEILDTKESIDNKELSYQALGMSILQIAKQGISKKHGNLHSCPNGRNIKTQTLKNIIWQARNQSIHHEDGTYNRSVNDCFADLNSDFGADFDLTSNATINLSTKVIDKVLKWDSYEDYRNDMLLILSKFKST